MHSPVLVLGRYRVLDTLGEGGMGAVYRGAHLDAGHEVALKTVRVAHTNELAAIRTEMRAFVEPAPRWAIWTARRRHTGSPRPWASTRPPASQA